MEYRYKPSGVCSSEMIIDIENDVIKSAKIVGGCPRKFNRCNKTSRR